MNQNDYVFSAILDTLKDIKMLLMETNRQLKEIEFQTKIRA